MNVATTSLEADDLMAEGSRRTDGLTDLGPETFTEGLGILTEALVSEANLTETGRLIASERILNHIVNRLKYVEDRKQHPEIAQERIDRPVFIVGFPRTGSTILHDILAQDPDSRAPLTWELMFPSPPPEAATFTTDPRIELAASLLPDPESEWDKTFRAMHPMGAELSQECVLLMADSMTSALFHNQFDVPTYMDWVDDGADWASVYAFHAQQLQHLQWRNARDRWVLKTGGHLWGLEHLLARYPDARIVFTHRDPVRSITSYASLATWVRQLGSDAVDPHAIAADWSPRLRQAVQHALDVRASGDFPDAVFYDMYFHDFVADQFAEVERIYDALDLPMTGQAADRMRAFVADNPKGKHGVHHYTAEEYGVDPAAVRDDFRFYLDRFNLSED